jgi:hypothetical protein
LGYKEERIGSLGDGELIGVDYNESIHHLKFLLLGDGRFINKGYSPSIEYFT